MSRMVEQGKPGKHWGLLAAAAIVCALVVGLFLTKEDHEHDEHRAFPDVAGPTHEVPVRRVGVAQVAADARELIPRDGFFVVAQNLLGKAVVGARIVAGDADIRSDQEGLVVFAAAPKALQITHADYAPLSIELSNAQRQRPGVTITLFPSALLRVRVTDQTFKPIAGAAIVLSPGHYVPETPETAMENGGPATGAKRDGIRRGATDSNGWIEFDGLGMGMHTLHASALGYVASAGKDGLSEFVQLQLDRGMNTKEVRMVRLFGAAIAFRHVGPGPEDALRTFTMIRMKYPEGLTDMPPSLLRANRRHEKLLKSLVDGSHMVWTKIARETRSMPDEPIERPVFASWLGLSSVRTKARFVPLTSFKQEDVRYVDMESPLPYGTLVVKAPFPVALLYLKDGKASVFRKSISPIDEKEVQCELPVGEYRLVPSMSLLSSKKRSKIVKIVEGEKIRVELGEDPPVCHLRVSVTDAQNRPTTAFSLNIIKLTRPTRIVSISGTGGSKIHKLCEAGEYSISLRDSAFKVVYNQRIEIRAGEEKVLNLRLK